MKHASVILAAMCLVLAVLVAGCGGSGSGTDNPVAAVQPATVGDRIVFSSNRKGVSDVFVMNPNGTLQTDLTSLPSGNDDCHPAFSWDGHYVAFTSNRKGIYELYVMSPTGTNLRRLTFNATSQAENLRPAWSPNGAKIAFEQLVFSGMTAYYSIWTINANGTGLKRLTNSGYQDQDPTWLPDGSGIVFTSTRQDHAYQIYRMKADGTAVTRLTFGGNSYANDDDSPACAPDVSRIAFHSNRKAGGIFTMKLNGLDLRAVPNTASRGWRAEPSWGPGGSALVFAGPPALGASDQIFKINLDGTGLVRLTKNAASDTSPRWGRAPT